LRGLEKHFRITISGSQVPFGPVVCHIASGEYDMFDFTPLYRSSVGFDRLFQLLDEAAATETQTYPPYNIERVAENEYRITMAIAGFGPADVNLEAKGNTLTVTGKKADKPAGGEMLHQGIAARGFERRFQLADHVEVKGADMDNGLLHIALERRVPEALKPRQIPIGGVAKLKAIDSTKAA
jgi:molecular chaperone IbpA